MIIPTTPSSFSLSLLSSSLNSFSSHFSSSSLPTYDVAAAKSSLVSAAPTHLWPAVAFSLTSTAHGGAPRTSRRSRTCT